MDLLLVTIVGVLDCLIVWNSVKDPISTITKTRGKSQEIEFYPPLLLKVADLRAQWFFDILHFTWLYLLLMLKESIDPLLLAASGFGLFGFLVCQLTNGGPPFRLTSREHNTHFFRIFCSLNYLFFW
jgi:hypothetical protein